MTMQITTVALIRIEALSPSPALSAAAYDPTDNPFQRAWPKTAKQKASGTGREKEISPESSDIDFKL